MTFSDVIPEFQRSFVKMHGLGNHFVIVDGRVESYRPDEATIVRLCDPRFGIGADQLVVLEPPSAEGADVFMRLYNVDGREVEACGNATRCVAWLLLEEQGADSVVVETLAGTLDCERSGDHRVTCDLGVVSGDWQTIPMAEKTDTLKVDVPELGLESGVAVNVGNPHIVFFVDDLEALDIETLAVSLQSNPMFPESVNVSFAEVHGPDRILLIVYERGAGFTLACGTGASAATWAARQRGLVEDGEVTVTLPGGDVQIEIASVDDEYHAVMTGPVAFAFRGEL